MDTSPLLSASENSVGGYGDTNYQRGDIEQRGGQLKPRKKVKALRIVIDEVGRHVDIALLPGGDSTAMYHAVSCALRDVLLPGDSWWLVDGDSREADLVVPLCSAIPDGSMLALRTSSGNIRHAKTEDFVPARGRSLSLQPPELPRPLVSNTNNESTSYGTEEEDASTQGVYAHDKSVTGSLRRSWFNLREALNFATPSAEHNNGRLERSLDDVNRLAKITAELANERTLLAWGRTALAVERTVFSFLSYRDSRGDDLWKHLYFIATAILASYAVFVGFLGTQRYYRIKSVLTRPNTPVHFRRLSVQPAIHILAALLAFVAISVYGHHVVKAS